MILFTILIKELLSITTTDIMETNYSEIEFIVDQMRTGKKIGQIYDLEPIKELLPNFESYANEIIVPSASCYIDTIRRLRPDCASDSESAQTALALAFTECYFNITNKLNEFPSDQPDSQKIKHMSHNVYTIYTQIKVHWRDLCFFSKDNLMQEELSKISLGLYSSLLKNAEEIKATAERFNIALNGVMTQLNDISNKTERNSDNLRSFIQKTVNLKPRMEQIKEIIKLLTRIVERAQLIFLVVIFAFLLKIFIPTYVLPCILISLATYLIDQKLYEKNEIWSESIWRFYGKIVYTLACSAFPLYKLFRYFFKSFNTILEYIRLGKKKEYIVPKYSSTPNSRASTPRSS